MSSALIVLGIIGVGVISGVGGRYLYFNHNKISPKTKSLIDQTIENLQTIYSDNCRIYIRPSGTEPVIRVLVEAKNEKDVHSLSSEITNKLSLEINKIINKL